MNIGSLLTKTSRLYGDRLAIQYGDQQLAYAELTQRVGRLTRALQSLGVRPGDRVAIVQRNGPALFETLFACFRAGAVAVPINVRLHPEEVAFICQDCEARVLVATGEHAASAYQARERVPELQIIGVESITGALDYETLLSSADPVTSDAEVDPDDLAWLFYTSGTTGKPKGAMLTHRNLLAMLMNYFADVYPLTPEDIVLHAAPLTHGSGLFGLPAIAKGATSIILHTSSFDPQTVFALIQQRRVTTIAFLAPTQIKMLLNGPYQSYDLSSLRCIAYGGGPMYVEDMKQAVEAFGPVLVQIYGQGEAPMTISYLRREEHVTHGDPAAERRLASAGISRTDVEVRIVDDNDHEVAAGEIGEIVARGSVVMAGYWKRPDATAETLRGGWLHTGDIGMLDEQGYLYLLDRKKDMIISGGNNIYPREIEEVLLKHPAIYEVAVIGVPDPLWGESVKAIIALRPGMTITEEEVNALCRQHLAGYKKPRTVEFVSELPKSAYGKILKRELREQFWQGKERRI
ncbi:MAG TPA: long-chain fatty acid--CoA ligase [Ktedonobacteraceae bacterium]|jgi:acyl-CoA synthetase (AMP-forming)/AMP-acid ligase II|nr:long-chain fatty acid--CoA ligase [Ktedonobacteraceae bacterium]